MDGSSAGSVEALYAATYHRLVGVLTVVCGSRPEAEEVVQDAFMRLLPRAKQILTYEDPEAWLRSVAFRLASNRRRNALASARRWTRLRDRERHDGTVPADHQSVAFDVDAALTHLSRQHREVLVLHYLLNHSVEEIAQLLRVPTGTVKSRLLRAREQFSEHYSQEDDHVGSA